MRNDLLCLVIRQILITENGELAKGCIDAFQDGCQILAHLRIRSLCLRVGEHVTTENHNIGTGCIQLADHTCKTFFVHVFIVFDIADECDFQIVHIFRYLAGGNRLIGEVHTVYGNIDGVEEDSGDDQSKKYQDRNDFK